MNYDPSQMPRSRSNEDAGYTGGNDSPKYLPRMKVYTGTAGAIQTGLIPAGHLGLEFRKDKITPLGQSADVIVFATRPFALDTSTPGKVIRSYDPLSDDFKRIKETVQSGAKGGKFQWGKLVLMFERSEGRFCEIFAAPGSWRDEFIDAIEKFLPISQDDIDAMAAQGKDVSKLAPKQPGTATITTKLVERPGQRWHVPEVKECKTPFANAPELAAVIRECERFFAAGSEEKVADSTRVR